MQHDELIHLVLTTSQLQDRGISGKKIPSLLKKGALEKLGRGVYLDTRGKHVFSPKDRAIIQHIAVLKTTLHPILSHHSAAMWWGAPMRSFPQRVHLSTASISGYQRFGVNVHSNRKAVCSQAMFHSGFLTLSPLQTIVDCALTLPRVEALCIAHDFLHRNLCALDEAVAELLAPGPYGAAMKRTIAERLTPFCESPGETLFWDFLHEKKFVLPSQQVELYTGRRKYRPDFVWKDLRIIVEFDGEMKYSGVYGKAQDIIREEHLRQRDLERAGWKVLRVSWNEITRYPEQLRMRLEMAGIPFREPSSRELLPLKGQ